MEQLVQCPVCTLFLHNGMSLESHLDTHPKDKVIKALCSLSKNNIPNYGSRTPTPQSDRSYRSRSQTPVTEDSVRWNTSHRSNDSDRYWRRAPSRTKSIQLGRSDSPDVRSGDISFEKPTVETAQFPSTFTNYKPEKSQQMFVQSASAEFEPQYMGYQGQQEEREIKYSRSAEYNCGESTTSVFSHNLPSLNSGMKLQSTLVPSMHRRGADLVKMLPKPNNILMKADIGGVQYISPSVKPMHVMVPTTPTFVHKNVQNNMIMSGSVTGQIIDNKAIGSPMHTGQFPQFSSVVTQNSQIIYREMVHHNLEGKPYITSMPTVLGGHDNMANIAQSSSVYQNVKVVDQFGNASCMYSTPQQMLPKPCNTSMYNDMLQGHVPVDKSMTIMNDPNKTLIIEVGPIVPPVSVSICDLPSSTTISESNNSSRNSKNKRHIVNMESKSDMPGTSKGLKILSNIKVEVPVQHSKNMLNTVMDLTGPGDGDYDVCPMSPEKILPDMDDMNQSNHSMSEDTQPSTSSGESSSFSVIKNVGNPSLFKDSSKSDSKMEQDDSCPVPDLICNEKPSISPCSELSEHGDNSTDRASISPKPQSSSTLQNNVVESNSDTKPASPAKLYKNSLRLNNIFVKKHKKVLQIKNLKGIDSKIEDPQPSSSSRKMPEDFTITKIQSEKGDVDKSNLLLTVSVEKMESNIENEDLDADTEEQSMDMEPLTERGFCADVTVKEEVNSNEGAFAAPGLEALRPINVISYGSAPDTFDDDSSHRELLDLEATKNKQFVNMMNDNYFGDNIYADYFTPDRGESFEGERTSVFPKEHPKDVQGMYGIWGESSQKESEFVLPNFIHESYKIADSSGVEYCELERQEACERDSKADVLSESRSEGEPPLNICADERMPPRGELSGQESNGDMESPWSGMYNEVTPLEPYDLIARESWVSDGSDVDPSEKRDALEDELQYPKTRTYTCSQCGGKFKSMKELRSHRTAMHPAAAGSGAKTSYSRLITARHIKKEEKPDDILSVPGSLLAIDSKEGIASTMLQVYDAMGEAKPKIEGLLPQETKRRKKDYVCPTCKVDMLTDAAFHAHLKIHPLECLTCGKCFFRRANLALHIKTHLGIKNYKCEVCEKRFVTRQKLSEHMNIHTGRTPVKCTMCDDTFRRYSNMVQHRDRHHLKKKAKVRDYVCQCGLVFHSLAKLRWHKETHAPRPRACAHCGDKFVHAASLTRHVRRSHHEYLPRDRADTAPCPVCKQMYVRSNLRAHMATHSGKRPHHCVICNKWFTTKWNLKLHRWTHMSRSAKPYKCTLCKGAFLRQTEYISHMNAHKSVRPYTCNYCGCQFIRKYNCQRHVREHEVGKKYVCKVPECGRAFQRSYYLSEHMKVHSGVRPFACNICGKTSSNKSNHNKHVKIHHAREPVATEA